jgi:tungstate transport system ATP-binding protein
MCVNLHKEVFFNNKAFYCAKNRKKTYSYFSKRGAVSLLISCQVTRMPHFAMPLQCRPSAPTTLLPLCVRHLCFEAGGKRLLDDISFEIEARSCTVILGANGAGKSLLLRLCHGLLLPAAGTVTWGGVDAETARRGQAMVFQRPILLRRSVVANIRYVLSTHGVPRPQRQSMVAAALEYAGLTHLAARSARVLSGGEQQRLALARAWALQPQVLLLDEPTASLDPAATRAIEVCLDTMQRHGTKLIMSTHDLGQARRLADEVLFLHHGRLLEHTPTATFFTAPRSPEAAAFLEGRPAW